MNEFTDRAEAVEYLAMRLGEHCDERGIVDAIAEASVGFFAEADGQEEAGQATARLMVKGLKWVIRDDDLKLFDAFIKAVSAAAAAGFFMKADIPATAMTSLVTTVCTLVYNVARKGAKLTDAQCQTLLALKAHNAAVTESVLASELGISEAEVGETLSHLKAVRLADGTVVAIVAQDGGKRWMAAGV
jgi:biotin operon repressor